MIEHLASPQPGMCETETYESLVASYYTPVYRYLIRLTRDTEVAADLAQDTFTKAYTTFAHRRADAPLNAWIFRVATNEARQFFRRHRRITWLPWDDWGRAEAPRDFTERITLHDRIEQTLAQLTPQARACLLLHAWAGLTCGEISAAIGKSEAATKKIVLRARRRFREIYDTESKE